ncbi:low temperature requirement protein A [Micromonospora sp. CPCC 206061]|uniref:low temperature requirement protein A n=1 Tax=Micromonospora sp. CPCC 206061 TaxID=3122410 RepID=UPI002FF433F3
MALIELVATWGPHPLPGRRLDSREAPFAGGHLLERGGLFMIIAFGEAVLTTGAALTVAAVRADDPAGRRRGVRRHGRVVLAVVQSFRKRRAALPAHRRPDPGRAQRRLQPDGLRRRTIAAAAGDERVIAHPAEHADITTNVLPFGGPALYLGAQTWHAAILLNDLRRTRAGRCWR